MYPPRGRGASRALAHAALRAKMAYPACSSTDGHPMADRHCRSMLVRFALLLFVATAPPGLTAHAHAQDTLRVGRAIANSWSFVPLDVGIEARIFARQGLAIERVAFTGSARLQQGLAAQSIDIALGSGQELA